MAPLFESGHVFFIQWLPEAEGINGSIYNSLIGLRLRGGYSVPTLLNQHSLTTTALPAAWAPSASAVVTDRSLPPIKYECISMAPRLGTAQNRLSMLHIGGPRASTSRSNDVGVILGVVGRDLISHYLNERSQRLRLLVQSLTGPYQIGIWFSDDGNRIGLHVIGDIVYMFSHVSLKQRRRQ